MKKQLLSLFAALTVVTVTAQSPSTSWNINQQAIFPAPSGFAAQGIKFIDAVDSNVIWTVGIDWAAPNRNYNWFSRSTDGGNTFSGGNIFPDTNTYVIANLEGIDANTAWVSSFLNTTPGSKGAIHRTTDGGATWQNMTASGMYTNSAAFTNIVSFLTPSIGITQGDPVNGEFEIWRTTNGGLSWAQIPGSNIPDPLASEFAIVDLYAKLGTSYLWFGTNKGRMYRTADAGLTWSVAPVATITNTLLEIAFTTPMHGITYVFNGSGIDVYNTSDGGATWTFVSPTGNIGYSDVKGIPGTGMYVSFGFGTGNEVISYSMDNGLSWVDWGSTQIPYYTGDFVSGRHGWAGGFDFPNTPFYTNLWKYSGATLTGTAAPTSAFTLPVSVCLTANSVTASPANSSVGAPTLTYSWTSAPGTVVFSSSSASAPVMSFNAAGTYTIMLTVTNAYGSNTSVQMIDVQACSVPSVGFAMAQSGCLNIGLGLVNTSSGGFPAPTYSWSSSGNVSFLPSNVASNPTIVATTAGVYSITLTGFNEQGSAQATHTVNMQSCAPNADFTIPESIMFCNPTHPTAPKPKFSATNNTTVNPNAGVNSYTWSIAPTNSVQAPGLNAINWTVTVRHATIQAYVVTLRAANASGATVESKTITVDFLCLGVDENNAAAQGLLVYPNPSHDVIKVSLPSSAVNYQMHIVNVLGTVVQSETIEEGSTDKTISIAALPKGVYFLTLESANSKHSSKLIIE